MTFGNVHYYSLLRSVGAVGVELDIEFDRPPQCVRIPRPEVGDCLKSIWLDSWGVDKYLGLLVSTCGYEFLVDACGGNPLHFRQGWSSMKVYMWCYVVQHVKETDTVLRRRKEEGFESTISAVVQLLI